MGGNASRAANISPGMAPTPSSLRVLLADDHRFFARATTRLLQAQAPLWDVELLHDASATLVALLENRHDAVLLDWYFKGDTLTGVDICRRAREAGCSVPIVMLTVADEVEHRVVALDAGADEYLVKDSFTPLELCRRVQVAFLRAQERRTPIPPGPALAVTVGPITIHPSDQTVFVHGRLVHLPKHERRILVRLGRTPGEVVSHAELCEVSQIQPGPAFRNLHNEVSRARDRLGHEAAQWVQTVRGSGYRLGKPGIEKPTKN